MYINKGNVPPSSKKFLKRNLSGLIYELFISYKDFENPQWVKGKFTILVSANKPSSFKMTYNPDYEFVQNIVKNELNEFHLDEM